MGTLKNLIVSVNNYRGRPNLGHQGRPKLGHLKEP
jgi:hypothetical protein